ncbi:MAG: AAA family ATPase [Lachnospiraceae bacterium]|nr:AAA family ATPase [Lachnospiraceae bacterium]
MFRNFYEKLKAWDASENRKPLLVMGARQVGKTWIIKEFCEKTYGDYIYLNLERQEDVCSIFESTLEPSTIVKSLEQLLGRRIEDRTPIFIDEIQKSERAITSLKYFCESDGMRCVIGAGSLLGVKLARFESSFPVGKVDIKTLYPMDFEEFLIACDETALRDGIREAFDKMNALPSGIHEKALRIYHDYLMVGGMPDAVADYLQHEKNVIHFNDSIHDNLRLAYLADMTKYTTSAAEGVKITEIYQSIPRQLAKENPKFKYNEVRPMANRRDFSAPLDWLKASGLVIAVRKLDAPLSPLKGYESETGEKIYLSDAGLLSNMCGLKYRDLLPDENNIYKGAVLENYVVEEFRARGRNLNYFKPSESMEIDLVYDDGTSIVPVEIKSGRHKRSTSLKNYIEKYKPAYAIRVSERNFGEADGVRAIPLYALWAMELR